jgi:hypothetical protein
VSLACVVGAESKTTRGSCAGSSGRTSPTDGTHGSARTNERTDGQADERTSRDSERKSRARRSLASTSGPYCAARGRERRERERARTVLTGGDRLTEKGERARLVWHGLVGPNWLFRFSSNF